MAAHVDLDRVRAAAAAVLDPEIGRPLGELGMIGETSLARGGRVRLQLRLTTESCPLAGELRTAVEAAARAVDGVRDVEFDLVTMPPRERVELAERLKRTTAPLTGALGIGGTRVYAVASGKGGVGKSTVTANLATALAATGKRVGLLDADVWGYSIPQLFGVRRSPVVLGELMLPVPAYGVALMSIGFFVNEDQPVVWRGPMLHKALQQFVTDTFWGTLDALFVDLPPGTGDATLSLLQLLPDTALLAVTTPQAAARVVATRVARMAAETGVPVAGVIENMSAAECGAMRCADRDIRHRRRSAAGRGVRRAAAWQRSARPRAARGRRPRHSRRNRRTRGKLCSRADPNRDCPANPRPQVRRQSTPVGCGLTQRAPPLDSEMAMTAEAPPIGELEARRPYPPRLCPGWSVPIRSAARRKFRGGQESSTRRHQQRIYYLVPVDDVAGPAIASSPAHEHNDCHKTRGREEL